MSESQQIRDARTLLHEANSYFSMALGEGPLSCILFMNPHSHDFSLYKSEWSFSDFVGEPARKKLLNEAGKSGRPILILDASTDSRLADVKRPDGVSSILCLPIIDEAGVLGFLYSETKGANRAFNQKQLDELEKYIKGVSKEWNSHFAPVNESDWSLLSQWGMTAALVFAIVFCFGAYRVSSRIGARPTTGEVIQPSEVNPEVVVSSFLTALKLRRFDSAYFFLDDGLKKKYSPTAFKKIATLWMEDDANAWELKYRKAGSDTAKAGRVTVRVISDAPNKRQADWRWHLVQRDEGWKLYRFDGGLNVAART